MSKYGFVGWPALKKVTRTKRGKGYFRNVCKLSIVPEPRAVSTGMLFLTSVAFITSRLYDSSKLKRK